MTESEFYPHSFVVFVFGPNLHISNLIFEYPNATGSPSFVGLLATLKGSANNDAPIVAVSSTHSVYKISQARVRCLAYVRRSDSKELKLQTLRDEESTEESVRSPTQHETDSAPQNPALVLSFLKSLLDVLQDYFSLSALMIEANYDVLCNLLQELIQGGNPYITDVNTMRDYVSFKSSWSSKLLSSTNQLAKSYVSPQTTMNNAVNSNLKQQPVPWRRADVKYTQNELFVDLTERINIVLSPRHPRMNKTPHSSHDLYTKLAVLEGSVDFTSHMSGVPDVALNLSLNGHNLGIPSLHRCVRLDRWMSNEGLLSFIPPDGKTTLMQYTVDLDQYSASKTHRNVGVVIPEYRQGLGTKKNEFEIVIRVNMLRGVSKVDNLCVKVMTKPGLNVKILRLSHGDFQTKAQGFFQWVFDCETAMGINAVLRGIVEDSESEDAVNVPEYFAMSYTLKGALPSGIRVGSVKVSGLNVTPYKGVKYLTETGDFVIR